MEKNVKVFQYWEWVKWEEERFPIFEWMTPSRPNLLPQTCSKTQKVSTQLTHSVDPKKRAAARPNPYIANCNVQKYTDKHICRILLNTYCNYICKTLFVQFVHCNITLFIQSTPLQGFTSNYSCMYVSFSIHTPSLTFPHRWQVIMSKLVLM